MSVCFHDDLKSDEATWLLTKPLQTLTKSWFKFIFSGGVDQGRTQRHKCG